MRMQKVLERSTIKAGQGTHHAPTRTPRNQRSRSNSTAVRAAASNVIGEAPPASSGSIIELIPRASPVQITHETSCDDLARAWRAGLTRSM